MLLRRTGPLLFLASITLTTAALAGPVTVGFDELDASGGDTAVPPAYLGLTWNNFTAYTTAPGFAGFNNGIVSPGNAAYSGGETAFGGIAPVVGSITSAATFDFVGAALGAGYYDGLVLTAKGSLGGSLLFTKTVTLDTTGAKAFIFNFSGIDTLTFTATATAQTADPFACGTFDCTQFTLDDVRLVKAVPEPGALALFLAGLGAITARRALQRRSEPLA